MCERAHCLCAQINIIKIAHNQLQHWYDNFYELTKLKTSSGSNSNVLIAKTTVSRLSSIGNVPKLWE